MGTKKLARATLEKVLDSKELIYPNAKITREEGIKKLKEAKDLVDIEMMEQK